MTAIYAHRGGRGERPENTVEAFLYTARIAASGRTAAGRSIAGIECDIALTRDLVPVVHHDPDLSPGGLICDLRLAELNRLAPQVPTLAQALDAAPDMEWLIEIKTFADAPDKTHSASAMAEGVLAVLGNAGKLQQACILAFDWRVLSAVAKYAPDARRICLTEPGTERSRNVWWGDAISAAETPDAVAQSNAYGWAPFHETLSDAQIARAHRIGLKLFPWTVNDAAAFERLAPMVDGIITDFPSLMSGGTHPGL